MKKKTAYDEDMPSDNARAIKDFLPPPEKLVLPNPYTKITLALDEPCVEFFKEQAKRTGVKYQRLIREVIRLYVLQYSDKRAA